MAKVDLSKQYNNINKIMISALENLGNTLLREIYDYVDKEIYKTYEPSIYIRLRQLLDSLEILPIQVNDNKFKLIIKIKDEMHELSNWDEDISPNLDLQGVFNRFASGEQRGEEIAPINDAVEDYIDTGKALNELKAFIKSKGLIIK